MNLRDYIGDTRTDSLPPGFLRSMKIKYKHEASHVFAGLQRLQNEEVDPLVQHGEIAIDESSQNKNGSREGDGKDEVEEDKAQNFMSWRVPSRLLNQKFAKTSPNVEKKGMNFKAKSASITSRRTTASLTARSLTSTSLKRNKKDAKQKTSKPKIENASQKKEKKLKINTTETNSGKNSSKSQRNRVEKKQRDKNDVKPANSRGLKPITLELEKGYGLNGKDDIPNKTAKQSREILQESKEEAVVAGYGKEIKKGSLRSLENILSKNPEVATNPKEKTSDKNAELKVVNEASKSDDGNRSVKIKDSAGIYAKRLSNKSLKNVSDIKELPKMKSLLPECIQNYSQKSNAALPMLNAKESRTSVKLSHTPERMDKIFDWVKKSTRREQEAAFNLLSVYDSSKNIEVKTPKKKERVRIALQVLETKRMPDSIKPLQLKAIKQHPNVTRFDDWYSSDASMREKKGMQTWHHVPIYHPIDSINNKSALFVQSSQAYPRHFSIHPEWGLHTRVQLTNAITT